MRLFKAIFLASAAILMEISTMASETPERYITSSIEQSEAFASLPKDQPVEMLNMIRFKEKAEYPTQSEFADKNWSGQEAYAEYGRLIRPIADRVGSSVSYMGIPELTVIGPNTERWDAIFVVRYPNAEAFFALVTDQDYERHAVHRAAAVEDSRLIRLSQIPAE